MTDTSPAVEPLRDASASRKALRGTPILLLQLVTASSAGARLCFAEELSAATQSTWNIPSSSTAKHQISPVLNAYLESIWTAANNEIIEEGVRNPVTDRLWGPVTKDAEAVVAAILSAMESGRLKPIVAAEVLKELGRIHDAASHWSRRWILQRGLEFDSATVRDGAGLGLARLGDPAVLPALRRAVERELDPVLKADLQLVITELEGSEWPSCSEK